MNAARGKLAARWCAAGIVPIAVEPPERVDRRRYVAAYF